MSLTNCILWMYKALARGQKRLCNAWNPQMNSWRSKNYFPLRSNHWTSIWKEKQFLMNLWISTWANCSNKNLMHLLNEHLCAIFLSSSFKYGWEGLSILRWIVPGLCTTELMQKSWKSGLGHKLPVHWLSFHPEKEKLRPYWRTLQKEQGVRGVSATAVSLLLGSSVFLSWQMQPNPQS